MNLIKKFIGLFLLKNWQIASLDEEGDVVWNDIQYVGKTVKYETYLVRFSDGTTLECADNHIFIDKLGNQVFAKDSDGLDIRCKDGLVKVVQVDNIGKSKHMYDVQLSDNSDHLYLTNGILSHNTTIYTVYILWYAMYHANKRVMICGNQLNIAIEIMDRIRLGYEYCPSAIKIGVTTYNKQCIEFENNSTIRCFATGSSGTRGFSANCVNKYSIIKVRLFGWLKLKLPMFILKWFGHERKEEYIEGRRSEQQGVVEGDNRGKSIQLRQNVDDEQVIFVFD